MVGAVRCIHSASAVLAWLDTGLQLWCSRSVYPASSHCIAVLNFCSGCYIYCHLTVSSSLRARTLFPVPSSKQHLSNDGCLEDKRDVFLLFMVALCNRADHNIFIHPVVSFFFLSSFFFFPRLISAVGDWMSTILLHMAWP